MLALALYNDNRPFTAVAAADVIWKNYRSGFLPITDSSGNQLSVPINQQNRYIGRPLLPTSSSHLVRPLIRLPDTHLKLECNVLHSNVYFYFKLDEYSKFTFFFDSPNCQPSPGAGAR